MSRIWKEKYDFEVARKLGIRDLEAQRIIRWDERGQTIESDRIEWNYLEGTMKERTSWASAGPDPQWIYYVHVCGFTFAFYSLAMIQEYLDYYSQKVLPSRIRDTPHCNNDLRQEVFMRLPLYLREEPKHLKVIKALQQAIKEFSK